MGAAIDHSASRTVEPEPTGSEPDSRPAGSEPAPADSAPAESEPGPAEPDGRPAATSPDEPVIRSSARENLRDSILGTRNLMTVAALGVVGAIMIVPLTYLSLAVAVNPRGILIMCALMGAWVISYLLPGVIVNKPGVFVISGFVMGVIAAFLTPQGPTAILGNYEIGRASCRERV